MQIGKNIKGVKTPNRRTCVFILGMHRSGTSLLGGLLNIVGVSYGSLSLKVMKEINAYGFFENVKIKDFNEEFFSLNNSSWHDIINDVQCDNLPKNNKLKEIILDQFPTEEVFFIKDPRICILFPIYEKVLEDLNIDIKVIIPYRHPIEVARSLEARDEFSMEKGYLIWVTYFLFAEYYSRKFSRVFVKYDDLLEAPVTKLYGIFDCLGLCITINKSKASEIKRFADLGLKHNQVSSIKLPILVSKIYSKEKWFNNPKFSEYFDVIRNEFLDYKRLFMHSFNQRKYIQLFYDSDGNGFSETKSIKQGIKDTSDLQEFEFDLSRISDVKSLRIDPLNDSVIVTLEDIFLGSKTGRIKLIELLQSNATVVQNNYFLFEDEDPQIEISLNKISCCCEIERLFVKLRYDCFGKDAVKARVKQVTC